MNVWSSGLDEFYWGEKITHSSYQLNFVKSGQGLDKQCEVCGTQSYAERGISFQKQNKIFAVRNIQICYDLVPEQKVAQFIMTRTKF
jgi:hypothetical protein